MSEIISPEEIRQGVLAVKAKVAKNAMCHLSGIDARSAATLQVAGILKRNIATNADSIVRNIVLDESSSEENRSVRAPYIFYKEPGSAVRYALELTSLFFDADACVREAAINHFLSKNDSQSFSLFKSTIDILNESVSALLGENEILWRTAALQCYDALENDILYHLAAVVQSLPVRYKDGVEKHLERILYPTDISVELLSSECFDLEDDRKFMILVREILDSSSVYSACDKYIKFFGHIPLADELSFSKIIRDWFVIHNFEEDMWSVIWRWAQMRSNSTAEYFACTFFIENKDFVPHGEKEILKEKILGLIPLREVGGRLARWEEGWNIRTKLAHHYILYLKARFPHAGEVKLANFSWWLSERVADALGRSDEAISYFDNVYIDRAVSGSQNVAQLVNPKLDWSLLGAITRVNENPWIVSLVGKIGRNTEYLLSGESDEKYIPALERNMVSLVISGVALFLEGSSDGRLDICSEGLSAARIALSTSKMATEFGKAIPALYSNSSMLRDSSTLADVFRNIMNYTETDQLFILHSSSILLMQRKAKFSDFWVVISDSEWRSRCFREMSLNVLGKFFEAMEIGRNTSVGEWEFGLPYMYVLGCQQAKEDPERLQAFFAFTVLSCIHTNSVGAVRRLLSEETRGNLEDAISFAKEYLKENSHKAPSWVRARTRAVLAEMS